MNLSFLQQKYNRSVLTLEQSWNVVSIKLFTTHMLSREKKITLLQQEVSHWHPKNTISSQIPTQNNQVTIQTREYPRCLYKIIRSLDHRTQAKHDFAQHIKKGREDRASCALSMLQSSLRYLLVVWTALTSKSRQVTYLDSWKIDKHKFSTRKNNDSKCFWYRKIKSE